jgi:pimeloyl-ACP methyl ester carboxylesterase
MGRSSPQKARTYSGWADDLVAVADALGHHEFGVTGWSEGGPWALAAATYIDPLRLRHVSSIAGGSYGTFGDNWAAEYLSKIDALGGTLALRFKPAFRLMYASLGITANTFARASSSKCRTASTNTADSFCFGRRSRPTSAAHAQNASLTVPTGWSATLNFSIGDGLST